MTSDDPLNVAQDKIAQARIVAGAAWAVVILLLAVGCVATWFMSRKLADVEARARLLQQQVLQQGELYNNTQVNLDWTKYRFEKLEAELANTKAELQRLQAESQAE